MEEEVPPNQGKMIAVLKISPSQIQKACQACSEPHEHVMPANYNGPHQTVISGHANACKRVLQWFKEHITTPYRCVELKVAAPFHCELMKPAADRLKEELEQFSSWSSPRYPYIANVDAQLYGTQTDPKQIKRNLYQQIYRSVLWAPSVAQLPDHTLCLEVGPGKVLTGLVRKINPRLQTLALDQEGAWEELGDLLST